jgi:hypothetical protein
MSNIVDMIRTTADNQYELMLAIAEHLESLETQVAELTKQVNPELKTLPKTRQRKIKPVESK